MKVCMVGHGAFAKKHLDGLKRIQGAEVISICGRTAEATQQVAGKYGIPHWTTNLEESLSRPGLDAVILTSVEFDHADIYKDLDAVKTAFKRLVNLIPQAGYLVAYDNSTNVDECIARAFCKNSIFSRNPRQR